MIILFLEYVKNYRTCARIIFFLFLCCKLSGEENQPDFFCLNVKKPSPVIYGTYDMYEEDKVLKEAYELGGEVYKKIIELAVLYYCKDIMLETEILYDKILKDTYKDIVTMIKCLALYIPLVCKNKKISRKVKAVKLACAGCAITVLAGSLRAAYCGQALKK